MENRPVKSGISMKQSKILPPLLDRQTILLEVKMENRPVKCGIGPVKNVKSGNESIFVRILSVFVPIYISELRGMR